MGRRATEEYSQISARRKLGHSPDRRVAGGDYGHPKHQPTLPFLRELTSTSSTDIYNQCPSHTVLGRNKKIEQLQIKQVAAGVRGQHGAYG